MLRGWSGALDCHSHTADIILKLLCCCCPIITNWECHDAPENEKTICVHVDMMACTHSKCWLIVRS